MVEYSLPPVASLGIAPGKAGKTVFKDSASSWDPTQTDA